MDIGETRSGFPGKGTFRGNKGEKSQTSEANQHSGGE